MTITKEESIQSVTITPDGQLRVRTVTAYFDDGVLGAQSTTTRNIDVGVDVSGEDLLVRDIVDGALHSQARIDARELARRS